MKNNNNKFKKNEWLENKDNGDWLNKSVTFSTNTLICINL